LQNPDPESPKPVPPRHIALPTLSRSMRSGLNCDRTDIVTVGLEKIQSTTPQILIKFQLHAATGSKGTLTKRSRDIAAP
jgi:hypothetical protein